MVLTNGPPWMVTPWTSEIVARYRFADERTSQSMEEKKKNKKKQHRILTRDPMWYRLEQERRRQAEIEKQMLRQKEIEQEKEEQRKRAQEQREAARK